MTNTTERKVQTLGWGSVFALIAAALLSMGCEVVRAFTQEYSASISATQSNSAVTFVDNGSGGSGQVFGAKSVTVINNSTSSNEVYVNLRSTTATTAGIEIQPGESFTFTSSSPPDSFDGWTGMGLICATGETATVRVTAVR